VNTNFFKYFGRTAGSATRPLRNETESNPCYFFIDLVQSRVALETGRISKAGLGMKTETKLD